MALNEGIESPMEISEAASLVEDVAQHASNVLLTVHNLLNRVKNEEFQTTKGINFLNVKSHMLLSYLSNLTYVILKKMCGKPIENDPSIERLVELRTVLEKMRPIDEKLKYQIQKLLASAATGNINSDDPLHFRANPNNLVSQFDGDEDNEAKDSDEEKANERKSNVYVPPKIAATYYDEDETEQSRQKQHLEKIKKHALNSSILQELRQEYDAGPDEIKEVTNFHRQKFNEEMKERNRYEEEYMLRLPLTKRQKHEAKKVSTVSSMRNLAKFDNISALEFGVDDVAQKKKRSSKKFTVKKGKRKSFKRKRH